MSKCVSGNEHVWTGGECYICGEEAPENEEIRPVIPLVTKLAPRPSKEQAMLYMALNSRGAVPAGAMVTMVGRPQIPFQPEGMMIPKYYAESFVIDDIRIGNHIQLGVSAGEIPADLFSVQIDSLDLFDVMTEVNGRILKIMVDKPAELMSGRRWKFSPIYPGQDFIINATNITGIARALRIAVIGIDPTEK